MKRLPKGRVWSRQLLWITGFGTLVLAGCGSGDYNRRMETTITKLNEAGDMAAAVYAQASEVLDTAGSPTGISLRLPVFIGSDAKALRAGDAGARPPFVNLPGYSYGYEVQVGGQPAYAYFAAVAASGKTAEAITQEIQAQISKAFSSATWQDTPVASPEGGSVNVKLLSVIGSQAFGAEAQEGRFDLYLVSSATHHVLLGWRAPVATADNEKIFQNVAISMGTIQGSSP